MVLEKVNSTMNSNDLIHNLPEKGILNFNHISKTLSKDKKAMLIRYYGYYHCLGTSIENALSYIEIYTSR